MLTEEQLSEIVKKQSLVSNTGLTLPGVAKNREVCVDSFVNDLTDEWDIDLMFIFEPTKKQKKTALKVADGRENIIFPVPHEWCFNERSNGSLCLSQHIDFKLDESSEEIVKEFIFSSLNTLITNGLIKKAPTDKELSDFCVAVHWDMSRRYFGRQSNGR